MGWGPVIEIIDAHVHAWPPDSCERLPRPGWDELAKALDLGGVVDRLVLVTPGQPPGDDRWTLDVAGARPAQVAPVLRAQGLQGTLTSSEAAGIRVVTSPERRTTVQDSVELAVAQDRHICVQNPGGDWSAVAGWAAAHSTATFVIDHLGHPNVQAGTKTVEWRSFLELATFANVFIKLPNLPFFAGDLTQVGRLTGHLRDAHSAFGSGRIMWASDWPNAGPEYLPLLEAGLRLVSAVDEAAVDAVFALNARRVFWDEDAS